MRFLPIFLVLFSFSVFGQEQMVGSLTIQGNERTKTALLKKMSLVQPGTVLDSSLIDKDISRLRRLPSISHAYYHVRQNKVTGAYDVIYGVEENFTLIPFANLFSSSNDDFAFRIGLQEFNFLGRNMTLGAFYQYDIFSSYGLGFRAPFLFGKKTGLAINYNDLTTQEPVFLDEGTADYRYNNTGIEVLGIHQFNLRHRLELGASFFTEDYTYLFGATNPNVPLDLNVEKFLYKLIYEYNAIDYYYQYLSGFRSNLNLQYVTSTDTQLPEFWIGFNDFLYYVRVGERGNWASRLRLGLSSNIDSPFAPFTVDNNLNIRGVGNSIDRGTAAIVLNTEYRHSLIDKDWFVLQGNVFIDGGSWRNPGGDFGDFGNKDNLRVYPGVGIRFIHKRIFNAIFRIDYGHGITQDGDRGVVFGIGQYF